MHQSSPFFRQYLALIIAMALVLGQATLITPAFAADADPTTKIRHRAPGYFVPEHRIKLEADVRDKEGLKLVRCYFRAAGEENFVFVGMEQAGGNKFQGILPAPSVATQELEYLFLAVNNQNQVVKTQTFSVGRDDTKKVPAWQDVSTEGTIQVATELETAPEVLAGFQDNITVDVVESSLRFGVVAGGLYAANAAVGGTSGAAATASSAGAVTAGAGISTTAAVVGGAVAVGAVAGGAAAAGGGGGGSSGDSSGGGGGSGGGSDGIDRSSLDGRWTRSPDNIVVDIRGSTGVFVSFGDDGYRWYWVAAEGKISPGEAKFRNIRKTSDNTWSAEERNYSLIWVGITITIDSSGRSFMTRSPGDSLVWRR